MKGVVKWFNEEKGFGFIVPEGTEDRENNIFVHWSDIMGNGFKKLDQGDNVSYDLEETDRGIKATNVLKY